MKKKSLLSLCLILISLSSYSQKKTPEQQYSDGLQNGCLAAQQTANDGQSYNNAYYSIVNNYSQNEFYRNGYREGWEACRKAVLNGVPVPENKLPDFSSINKWIESIKNLIK